ncbi:hypothetical protein KI387_021317, partial [Taxus chinensis]
SMLVIGTTSISDCRISTFGQKPLFGEFGTPSPAKLSPAGSIFGETRTALLGQPFVTISTSACGSTLTPAFRGTTPVSGAINVLSYGAPCTPATGTSRNPAIGIGSTPVSGQPNAAFGGTSTPTFGNSRTFGSTACPFGSQIPAIGFGQTPFSRPRGSCRLATYRTTYETDNSLAGQAPENFISISTMPQYKNESHEELRWEDYQLGNKGCNISFHAALPFGHPTPPLGKSTSGKKSSFGGFGSPGPTQFSPRSTQVAFRTPSFGAAIPPAFGADSTSAFHSTTTPAFGSTLTPAFAFGTQPFGPAILSAFGAASTSAFGSTLIPAFGSTSTPVFDTTTTSFDVTNVPAFGAPSTSASMASSIPSLEFFISPFGATSATTFAGSSSGSTSCQTEPTSRTQLFGAAVQPAFSFSATSIPAFGSPYTIGTTTSFGATNVPGFSAPSTSSTEASSIPSFNFFSTPAFGATSATTFASNPSCQTEPAFWTKPFGAAVQPAFSATGIPPFGCPYIPGIGTATTSFGATNLLAFGATNLPAFVAPSTAASEASSIHSFELCGPPNTMFAATSAPTFGSNGSPFGCQSSAS